MPNFSRLPTRAVLLDRGLCARPDTWPTLSNHPSGFEGIGNTHSWPGLSFRVDLLLDEQGGR